MPSPLLQVVKEEVDKQVTSLMLRADALEKEHGDPLDMPLLKFQKHRSLTRQASTLAMVRDRITRRIEEVPHEDRTS